MEEALVKREVAFMTDEETTEVAEVSKGAFDLPAFAIAAQRASILQGGATAPRRCGQINSIPRAASLSRKRCES